MFTPRLDLHQKRQTDVLFNAGGGGRCELTTSSGGLKGGPAVANNPCPVDSGPVPGLPDTAPDARSALGGETRGHHAELWLLRGDLHHYRVEP